MFWETPKNAEIMHNTQEMDGRISGIPNTAKITHNTRKNDDIFPDMPENTEIFHVTRTQGNNNIPHYI